MNARWHPCEHPERPNDPYMAWHLACRGCYVAAVASRRRWPNDSHVAFLVGLIEANVDNPLLRLAGEEA